MGGFSGILGRAGKALAEGGVGKAVAEVGEHFLEAHPNKASDAVLDFAHKTFGLESQLTGPAGERLNTDLKAFEKDFEQKQAFHLNESKTNPQSPVYGAAPFEVKSFARRHARVNTLGKNDSVIAQHLDTIATLHDEEKAKNVADSLGIYFHDQVRMDKGVGTSELTSNLRKNPLTRDIDFRLSPYKATGDIERGVQTVAHAALAPKAGIAHLTTPLNMLLGQSLTSFAKATTQVFGSNYQGARAEIQTLNAIGSMFMEEAEQHYKFQNGIIKQYLPGSIGEFINKNWQIPFMSALRQRTMTMAAMQGKFSAMESAVTLLDQNASSKAVDLAKENLKYHGIDWQKVHSNGGKLMPEDIRSAMYENVNNRVFIQTGRYRAPFGTQNALGRMVGMYHNYGVAQSKFIQREIVRSIKRGDPMGVVRDLAVLGVIFPAVGTGVYGIEQAMMGHTDQAKEEFHKMGGLLNPAGYVDGKLFADRIEGISHAAGFGVLNSYSRAAGRKKLLGAIAGPVINAGSEIIQDTMSGFQNHPSKLKAWKPLARDILHDVPSAGIGAYISNKMLPSQAEINKKKPMTARRMAAQRAAEKRKLNKK